VETVLTVGCGRPSPSDHNRSLGGPGVVIAIPTQPSEEPASAVVGPIRLVCQEYIDAGDPDAYMHVGEVVREALAQVAAGRGPATGLVVQVYTAELAQRQQ
jgi:hypothetical protein